MSVSTALRIESSDTSIAELLQDFYAVPDFQREFVWRKENVERLLSDINDELAGTDTVVDEAPDYFIGSIVVYRSANNTYQLIDGQQRITTLFLVLLALRRAYIAINSNVPHTLDQQIRASTLLPNGEEVQRSRLTVQYSDNQAILEAIASAPDIEQLLEENANNSLIVAYRTAAEFIEENCGRNRDAIKKFLAVLTLRVKVIRIITPDLSRSLKVFETINDRGIGLDAMDLLKNLLFQQASDRQYSLLKDRWRSLLDELRPIRERPLRFLRYHILSNYDFGGTQALKEDGIYQWITAHREVIGISSDPAGFLDELYNSARVYRLLAESKSPTGREVRYLANLRLFAPSARQHFILLLAGSQLSSRLFEELCHHIENLHFCFTLVKDSPKLFEQKFAGWAADVREIATSAELEQFVQEKIAPEMIERARHFDRAFSELTDRIPKKRLQYILAKLSQCVDEQAGHVPSNQSLNFYLNTTDIDHIAPKSPSDEILEGFDRPGEYAQYCSMLGNLVLLQKSLNSSAGNGSYVTKRQAYRQSSFLLTRSIVDRMEFGRNTRLNQAVADLPQFDEWNSASIEKRQYVLGRLARKVWLFLAS